MKGHGEVEKYIKASPLEMQASVEWAESSLSDEGRYALEALALSED